MRPAVRPEVRLEWFAKGGVVVWADPDVVPRAAVGELFALPMVLDPLRGTASRAAALRTLWRWSPQWLAARRTVGRLVVRQYAHGGLWGRLLGRHAALFCTSRPMLRELQVALHARQQGVPTARPVALRIQKKFGLLLTAQYVTEEIPEARDLLELSHLVQTGASCPAPARQAIARAVAAALAALHAAGIRHGDLNLKNLLVSERHSPPRAYVIDFKKARLQREVSLQEGLAGLVRLDRSVLKWSASRNLITVADRLRVLREYVRLRAATADWKGWARTIRTRHLLHAVTRQRS